MKITDCKVNHLVNPMGYDLAKQTFTWKYEKEEKTSVAFKMGKDERGQTCIYVENCSGETECIKADAGYMQERLAEIFGDDINILIGQDGQVALSCEPVRLLSICECRVQVAYDWEFCRIFHDSGVLDTKACVSYETELKLAPCTRYYWRVMASAGGVEIASDTAWFETGKMDQPWVGQWIAVADLKEGSPIVRKTFSARQTVKKAVGYMTGLGLYECYLNGHLVNDGYLQPGYHNYNTWQQYQTIDLTDMVRPGDNVLGFLLGAGWYKGCFGINGGTLNTYGENYQLLCELRLTYADGSEEVIGSDDSFMYAPGPVILSNIYDGEIYDATKEPKGWLLPEYAGETLWKPVMQKFPEHFEKLAERLSIPVICKEILKPAAILTSPSGKKILDMGQNMTGWITFTDRLRAGQTVTLSHAELLQDGELCTHNLKDARQEFCYTSAGDGRSVRPHFTYYGFRYVELGGFLEDVKPEDFEGWNLYSDLETTGRLTTGNPSVNQFIHNAFWSQRDNFLDHPTDCPQRSERLGWTGDAQMYCPTACYFMDTAAFYRKYMREVNEEQFHHEGIVSFIVPRADRPRPEEEVREITDMSSAAWSDVATIIPWTLYLYYGDKNLLAEQYPGMKAWVDAVIKKDEADGKKRLWQSGFHFGDWLALDNVEPGPFGLTDKYYIASCYYYYSTKLVAKAASVLGNETDHSIYGVLAEDIRQAILKTYFDERQVCRIDTQTAYILAIYMDIVSSEAIYENGRRLANKIRQNGGHLDTGFVGTPYICPALTKAGQSGTAYELLLKNDFPSWLYQVTQGATTVWESWSAQDDILNGTGDGSLNHYAFGSIVEWLFADVCGIRPLAETPGFERLYINPHPDERLGYAKAVLNTAAGCVESSWSYDGLGNVCYRFLFG